MGDPRLSVHHVRIPMRYAFGHARATRSQADNVIVRVELADGAVGFGECVPREYVTGETIQTVLDRLGRVELAHVLPSPQASFGEAVRHLWELDLATLLSAERLSNAAACALEVAVLDAHGRRDQREVLDALDEVPALSPLRLPVPQDRVRRTLTIGDDIEAALARAGALRLPIEVKLKVGFGPQADLARLARVREALGAVDLRMDANGIWKLDEAIGLLRAFSVHRPTCIEEPLPRAELADCARLRTEVSVQVMLDESLCTLEDARAIHAAGAADLLNLRISKCGGLLNTLRIALFARAHGLGYQLGSMVGETGILGCLGRSFTARVAGVRYFEAGLPSQMLELDVTDAALGEEPGTRMSPVPAGPGLGAGVDYPTVERFTVSKREVR